MQAAQVGEALNGLLQRPRVELSLLKPKHLHQLQVPQALQAMQCQHGSRTPLHPARPAAQRSGGQVGGWAGGRCVGFAEARPGWGRQPAAACAACSSSCPGNRASQREAATDLEDPIHLSCSLVSWVRLATLIRSVCESFTRSSDSSGRWGSAAAGQRQQASKHAFFLLNRAHERSSPPCRLPAFCLAALGVGSWTHLIEAICVGELVTEAQPADHEAASIPPGSRHQARCCQVATLQAPQNTHQEWLTQAAHQWQQQRPVGVSGGSGAAEAAASVAQAALELPEASCQWHRRYHWQCGAAEAAALEVWMEAGAGAASSAAGSPSWAGGAREGGRPGLGGQEAVLCTRLRGHRDCCCVWRSLCGPGTTRMGAERGGTLQTAWGLVAQPGDNGQLTGDKERSNGGTCLLPFYKPGRHPAKVECQSNWLKLPDGDWETD